MRHHSAWSAILLGGTIAGALDITYAIGFSAWRGVAPRRILQSVASGLLGAPAFDGGWPAAALGLVLHFCIALSAAAIFWAASRWLSILVRRAVIAGILYGAAIYAVMNLVVVPLSAFPRKLAFPPIVFITGLLVHMFCIGLPIALAARWASADSARPPR
ncbi:MAG TPA: hypothetical protein VK474_03355 [Chthoniobacterales bacterium]|nr:hypothetical protein [Chthoniobacterales bacterium]